MKKLFLAFVMFMAISGNANAAIGGYVIDLECKVLPNAQTVFFEWEHPGLKHGWVYINGIEQGNVWGVDGNREIVSVDAESGSHVLVLYYDYLQEDYGQANAICE